MNTGGLGGLSSDSLYGMFINAGMSAFAGGSEVGVTDVEYVENCFVGGWAHELVPVTLMPVGEDFLCS